MGVGFATSFVMHRLPRLVVGRRRTARSSRMQTGVEVQVRALRYLLVEVAEGPISAFMADDAARIIGDGIGRLFS